MAVFAKRASPGRSMIATSCDDAATTSPAESPRARPKSLEMLAGSSAPARAGSCCCCCCWGSRGDSGGRGTVDSLAAKKREAYDCALTPAWFTSRPAASKPMRWCPSELVRPPASSSCRWRTT